MLSTPALPCVLVTHAPPKGVLDRASKHTGRACEGGGDDQRVGDPSLLEIVRRASAKVPVLHLFGHVHARQWLFPSPEPSRGRGLESAVASVENSALSSVIAQWNARYRRSLGFGYASKQASGTGRRNTTST